MADDEIVRRELLRMTREGEDGIDVYVRQHKNELKPADLDQALAVARKSPVKDPIRAEMVADGIVESYNHLNATEAQRRHMMHSEMEYRAQHGNADHFHNFVVSEKKHLTQEDLNAASKAVNMREKGFAKSGIAGEIVDLHDDLKEEHTKKAPSSQSAGHSTSQAGGASHDAHTGQSAAVASHDAPANAQVAKANWQNSAIGSSMNADGTVDWAQVATKTTHASEHHEQQAAHQGQAYVHTQPGQYAPIHATVANIEAAHQQDLAVMNNAIAGSQHAAQQQLQHQLNDAMTAWPNSVIAQSMNQDGTFDWGKATAQLHQQYTAPAATHTEPAQAAATHKEAPAHVRADGRTDVNVTMHMDNGQLHVMVDGKELENKAEQKQLLKEIVERNHASGDFKGNAYHIHDDKGKTINYAEFHHDVEIGRLTPNVGKNVATASKTGGRGA